MTRQICFIEECGSVVAGWGMCKFHYQRYKHGIDLFLPKPRAKYHGLSHTRPYQRWANIMDRCYNQSCKFYSSYGGRGIEVYEPWHTDAQAFIEYVNSLPRPSNLHNSLDRMDNDGNYKPDNLRWATSSQQLMNTRNQSEPKGETGVTGVYRSRKGYRARINVNKKRIDLGTFKTLQEAVIARRSAELSISPW